MDNKIECCGSCYYYNTKYNECECFDRSREMYLSPEDGKDCEYYLPDEF